MRQPGMRKRVLKANHRWRIDIIGVLTSGDSFQVEYPWGKMTQTMPASSPSQYESCLAALMVYRPCFQWRLVALGFFMSWSLAP